MILFNEQSELTPAKATSAAAEKIQGRIEFDHVAFGYRADKTVLHDVSFAIEPGQTLALVGPSGAGKTTMFKLLARFYDVTSGSIKVDGRDARNWPLGDLRRAMISIQQDDVIFSRSIAENISMDPDNTNRDRVLKALTTVHASEIVARLPDGIDSVPGEQGGGLSAGEKQLLLFARAVYHDPAILLLDEATAAVDPHTEMLVQRAMETLMQQRTVLMIAHRLSTIEKADQILVLEGGRVIEAGNHTALLVRNGLYARFYQYQQTLQKI